MKIQGIIPVAGLGTRFLPVTKSIPKEMLPIVDKPTIHYIVEELIDSKISEIIFINGRGKTAIENYFDYAYELETSLYEKGKHDLVKMSKDIARLANYSFTRQNEPKGLGHAILCGKPWVHTDFFAVILGDDIIVKDPRDQMPPIGMMCELAIKHQKGVVGIMDISDRETEMYGVLHTTEKTKDGLFVIDNVEEKPGPKRAASRLGVIGRYVLPKKIFSILEEIPPGYGNEIQITDALAVLAKEGNLLGYKFNGKRYDVGDKLGYVTANIDFALNRIDLGESIRQHIKDLAKNL